MTILVVDDDTDTREMLADVLGRAGYEVLTAEHGQQAIDLFERGTRPTLMVLDLLLPKVSGWEVLKYLQDDPQLRHMPVVLLTGVASRQLRAVADAILIKPVEPKVVLHTIATVIAAHHKSS